MTGVRLGCRWETMASCEQTQTSSRDSPSLRWSFAKKMAEMAKLCLRTGSPWEIGGRTGGKKAVCWIDGRVYCRVGCRVR